MPIYAVMAMAMAALIITLPALKGNGENVPFAFFAVVSITVIGLYIAYVIPIFLRWRKGDDFEPGPWTNGRKYRWMNPFATFWVGLITIIFCLPFTPLAVPWNDEFTWEAFNYAPLTVGVVILLAWIGWMVERPQALHRPGARDRHRERDRRAAGSRPRRAERSESPL